MLEIILTPVRFVILKIQDTNKKETETEIV